MNAFQVMTSYVHAEQVLFVLHECAFIPPELEPEHWGFDCLSELLQGESAYLDPAAPASDLT